MALLVGAGDRALSGLGEVQLEGKRRMNAADFVRGSPMVGDRCRRSRQRVPLESSEVGERVCIFLPKPATFWLIWRPMESETAAPVYKRIVLKLSGEALREPGARENISPADRARDRPAHQRSEGSRRADFRRDRRRQHLARTYPRATAAWIARRPITWACSRR